MAASRKPPPLLLALLAVTGVVVVQALLVPLFASVAANSEPRDLPVVVAGPLPATEGFAARLAQVRPGAFEVTQVADTDAALAALRDREAYAAFLLVPDGVESLFLASAASPAVAQVLTQAVTELNQGAPPSIVDLVPGSPDDPRGAGLGAGFLPLVLTSMLAGVALVVAVSGRWARLFGLVWYGVLAGLASAAVMNIGLGVVDGSYLASAAVLGLIAIAAAGTVAGLGAALGAPGLGLGALLIFLVGNPLSAVSSAPEMLPQPWGEVGQWLPPGAGATLLRSVSWFDGAGATRPLWVLSGWAVLGFVLVLVGRARMAAAWRESSPSTSGGSDVLVTSG